MPNFGTVAGSGAKGAGGWVNGPADKSDAALASAARVVGTASSAVFSAGDADAVVARLNITNINGGNVTLRLQGSIDGTNFDDLGAFPNKSANGTHTSRFYTGGYSTLRWNWTVATATVTFAVDSTQQLSRR